MKNALPIASEKLYEPFYEWNPATKPGVFLPLYNIFLKNLFYDSVSSVFSESKFE